MIDSVRAPCVRCGRMLHDGTGRLLLAFTVAELAELACATGDRGVQARLLCAIGLLDSELADALRGAVPTEIAQ